MSTETTVFVCVKIALPDSMTSFPEPKQKLDEGEFVSSGIPLDRLHMLILRRAQIETRIVAIKGSPGTLDLPTQLTAFDRSV